MEITSKRFTAAEAIELTIEELAGMYLHEKSTRRKADTVYGYRSSLRRNVLPRWGSLTISEIDRDDLQAWLDELVVERGRGGAEKAMKTLRQLINWARKKWSLYILNPAEGVELPEKPVVKTETLTQRRLKRLIRGMVGCKHEATFIISAALGVRPSENYHLHWEHIDWRSGMMKIRGALLQIAGLVYESTTKTKHSERDLYLPPWALDRLHEIWVSLGRPKGRIIGDAKPSKVYRTLKRWATMNRLPWIGMKNLRHTWASIAAASGVTIEVVAAMLGHSNINTCYRYYLALTKATMMRAQRKVARTILGKTSDDMYRGIIMPMPQREDLAVAA